MKHYYWIAAGIAASLVATSAFAKLPDSKVLTLDLARTIAQDTIADCNARGYNHVSVAVVGTMDIPMVMIRDDGAPSVSIDVAKLKATTALIYNAPSRPGPDAPFHPEQGKRFGIPPAIVPGTMLNYGGLPIKAGDATIGAVGIDGAPGGAAVIACASAALKKIPDKAYAALPDSKVLTMNVARDIAKATIAACRAKNFKISALVVDAFNEPKAFIRDDGAAAITAEVVKLKARTALLKQAPSTPAPDMGPNRVSAALIPGTFRGRGGVPIKIGNATIGAVAVSGSRGSANDEACAKAGIAKVADELK